MFAEMNANGMSYPAYHLGHAVLLEQPRNRRRRAVAHVRHGHAVGAERALPGHGPRLAGREHRGQQRRDLAVRREPPERGDRRVRAAEREVQRRRCRRRTRCATTTPARLRRPCGRSRCRRRSFPAYTASDQADVLAGASGGHGARGADPLAPRTTPQLLEPRASPASASAASRTRTSTRTRTRRRSSDAIRSTPVLQYSGGGTAFELGERRSGRRDDDAERPRPRSAPPPSRWPSVDEPHRRPAVLRRHRPNLEVGQIPRRIGRRSTA